MARSLLDLDDAEELEVDGFLKGQAQSSQGNEHSRYRKVRIYGVLLFAFMAILSTSLMLYRQGKAVQKQSRSTQDTISKYAAPAGPCAPVVAPVAAVAPVAPAVAPPKQWIIMPMGDSITFGQRAEASGGYRCDLSGLLDGRGIPHTFVGPLTQPGSCGGHAGFCGITLDILTRRAKQYVTTYLPDVVLLQAGTNDFYLNGLGRLGGADPPTAISRMRMLLGEIYAAKPTAIVKLSTVTSINETLCNRHWMCPPNMPADIGSFNALLPNLVAEQKGLSRNIDLHDVNANAQWRREDYHEYGLHFTPVGYTKIANSWLGALLPLVQPR